jgi:hypothetical protein
MAMIRRSHAEEWQENETSIVLKMLDDSMKSQDQPRLQALQRSLLEIERKSGKDLPDSDQPSPEPLSLSSLSPSPSPLPSPVPLKVGRVHRAPRHKTQSGCLPVGHTGPGTSHSNPSGSTRSSFATFSTFSEGDLFSPSEQEYLNKAMKQNLKQYDAQLNLMIVGPSQSGKTSLVNALTGAKLANQTPHSVG